MNLRKKLIELDACTDAIEWVGDRTLEQAWQQCHRGDWMCWLLKKANMCDLRTLTIIKARQASLVKHLMKDQRSLDALQAAFDFAEGKISEAELQAYAYAAYAAYVAAYNAAYTYDAYTYAAAAACNAAYAHAYAAAACNAAYAHAYAASDDATYAAAACNAAYAHAYAASDDATYAAAKSEILRQCADIVREVILNPVNN